MNEENAGAVLNCPCTIYHYKIDPIKKLYSINNGELVFLLFSQSLSMFSKVNGIYDYKNTVNVIIDCVCINVVKFPNFLKLYAGCTRGQIRIFHIDIDDKSITEKKKIDVFISDINIISFQAAPTLNILFVLSSNNSIILVDLFTDKTIGTPVTLCRNSFDIQVDIGGKILYSASASAIQCFEINLPEKGIPQLLSIMKITPQIGTIVRMLNLDGINKLAVGFSNGYINLYDYGDKSNNLSVLYYHESPIIALQELNDNYLLSSDSSGQISVWDLSYDRHPVKLWENSNNCIECLKPFFFDIYSLLSYETWGTRRHHCRICGQSMCCNHLFQKHSSSLHGLEIPVLICEYCQTHIDNSLKTAPIKYCMSFNMDQLVLDELTNHLFIMSKGGQEFRIMKFNGFHKK